MREAPYNHGRGPVIALGFERYANEAMRARFAAMDRAEVERRRLEDSRIVWCDEGGGEFCG